MNERTIQLYKQALDFAHTTAGEDAGKGTIIESLTAGKFAELIVLECASIVDTYGRWILYDKLAVKIKREFGVEE